MNAIDTNVLVYSFDTDDPVRQQQAIELIDQLSENPGDTVLPWQVIVECLACLRRWVDRGRLSASDVDQHTPLDKYNHSPRQTLHRPIHQGGPLGQVAPGNREASRS
jgi:predicted nucleic acid-binding protein